jgi:hypothetical protein
MQVNVVHETVGVTGKKVHTRQHLGYHFYFARFGNDI